MGVAMRSPGWLQRWKATCSPAVPATTRTFVWRLLAVWRRYALPRRALAVAGIHHCRVSVQCAEGLGPAGNFLASKYGPVIVASLDDEIELSQNCSYGLGVMFESIGMESAPLIDTAIPALIALLRIPHYPHPPAQDNASAALARFVRWSIARHVRCGEPVA